MINKLFLTLLFAAFFLACASPKKGKLSKKQKQSWYLSIEETPCFGKCPMYELMVQGKGLSTVVGKRFVEQIDLPLGKATSRIADTTLAALVILTAKAEWSTYDAKYMSGYSDLPSKIIRYSIQPGDTFEVIYENKLAPSEIVDLGDALISYRKKATWTTVQLD